MRKFVLELMTDMMEFGAITPMKHQVEVSVGELPGVGFADAIAGAGYDSPRPSAAIAMVVVIPGDGGAAGVDMYEAKNFPEEE